MSKTIVTIILLSQPFVRVVYLDAWNYTQCIATILTIVAYAVEGLR